MKENKMKKIVYVLLVIFFTFNCNAKDITNKSSPSEVQQIINKGLDYYGANDLQNALITFKKGLKYKNAMVEFYLAYTYYELKDYQQAKIYFKKAIKHGQPQAYYGLAQLYVNGFSVKQDMQKAISLYKDGASKKDYNSLLALATIYYQGKYVEQDLDLSEKYATDGYIASGGQNISDVLHHIYVLRNKKIFGNKFYDGEGIIEISKIMSMCDLEVDSDFIKNFTNSNKLFTGSNVSKDIKNVFFYKKVYQSGGSLACMKSKHFPKYPTKVYNQGIKFENIENSNFFNNKVLPFVSEALSKYNKVIIKLDKTILSFKFNSNYYSYTIKMLNQNSNIDKKFKFPKPMNMHLDFTAYGSKSYNILTWTKPIIIFN